ncbi:hypothetical protein [Lacimicrobium alkaliphilum]|uniref:Uncharacterized protein n=1 Tax=Lacimicrobium alkaliphilum TaxID=1526571 RepID=A0ABQ1RQ94_9ALTE|nr:hypothetical protein [Lacimicrobium alkaliphilum]GGD74512.1 hypothetical protein GCM10011357_31930 [Lacimicrobium alkaliphilum]
MSSRGEYLQKLVDHCTHDDVVDTLALAEQLNCTLVYKPFSTADKGVLLPPKATRLGHTAIVLSEDNSEAENRSLIPLLLADYILNNDPNAVKRFSCDMFFLAEVRRYRASRHLFLATRLALPDKIIEKICGINFDSIGYARKAVLLPNFVNCAFHSQEVGGLLGLIDSLDMVPASLLKLA